MGVAIIGVGRFGLNYLKTLSSLNIPIDWICSNSKQSLSTALDIYKNPVKTTTNYKDIINSKKTSTIFISTPAITHYNIAKDCLTAGKNVLLEKPFSTSSKHAQELKKISLEKKVVLMVGHLHVFNPAIKKIKEDLKLFGKIRYIQMVQTGNGPIRKDVGSVWDFAPHFLSILDFLLENVPKKISYNGSSFFTINKDDVFSLNLDFEENIFASLFASWIHPEKQMKLIISAENGYVLFSDYDKNKLHYILNGNKQKIEIEECFPLTEQIRYFINCIDKNISPILNNVDKAISITKLIEKTEEK